MTRYLLLVDYDNCASEYISCNSKQEYARLLASLKKNESVEYIEVLEAPKTIHVWANPCSSPEDDF